MKSISAYHLHEPGSQFDDMAEEIFERFHGRWIGKGVSFVSEPPGEREIQYYVNDANADACAAALKEAGFKVTCRDLTPYEMWSEAHG